MIYFVIIVENFNEIYKYTTTFAFIFDNIKSVISVRSRREGDRITVRGWADDLKTLVSRTKTGGSTAAQILEARIKGSPIVDPSSVKIESMTDVGKDAALKQIVVVVKFGKEESR